LVAWVAAHCGGDVQMNLGGKLFGVGLPLDLFRANEAINARKRHWLTAEIARVDAETRLSPARRVRNASTLRAPISRGDAYRGKG